jgi:hypothetical protein
MRDDRAVKNSSSDEREEEDEVEEVEKAVEQRNVLQRMTTTMNKSIKKASTIDSCDNG